PTETTVQSCSSTCNSVTVARDIVFPVYHGGFAADRQAVLQVLYAPPAYTLKRQRRSTKVQA
ncbi:MAG: hypothetical protein JXC32_00070, partial [Anaerolineae bacterium]|nr:hypothetical protein [Anaerolineae bacterium]